MGRILAGLLFLAACVGERPEVTPPAQGGGDDTGGMPASRLVPQDCGDQAWQLAQNDLVDFAAVRGAHEFQALSVPLSGGAVSVYAFSKGSSAKPVMQLDAGMTAVSASLVGDYVIATTSNASSIHITVLTPDLSTSLPLAQVAPGLVAKSALQVADWQTILPVADDQGLRIETFDRAWNPTAIRVATTDPAIAMTAAPMQYATVAAWSTVTSCNLMTMYTAQTGPMTTVPGACLAPTMAIDPTTEQGVLAYEGDDGIRMIGWEHQDVVGVSQLIAFGGSSPRAVFDGTRIWISLLDADHHLVVGYVEAGRFISTTFATHPYGEAYDLVMRDGQVYAVTDVHDGFVAQHVCLASTTTL